MKIAHITTVHNYNDNRIFYKECASLRSAGYDVYLMACSDRDFEENSIHVVGLKKYRNRIKHFFLVSIIDVLRRAKDVNATVYHFHDPELLFAGIILKVLGKKVIYDVHEDNAASIMSKPYLKNRFLKKIIAGALYFLERIGARIFDAIVTARPDISSKFLRYTPVTVRNFPIIPSSTRNEEIFVKKTKKTVIYVGNISDIRGIAQLIQAFEDLNDYEFWLLGKWSSTTFKNRCEKMNGWKNVRYLGIVKPTEVFAFINEADVGIITFLPVPNHLTTLATKPFEYMAMGLPVIMSDFPYWRDFFEDLGIYVDPEDSADIKEKIIAIFENGERYRYLSTKGKEKVNNSYNWEAESKKLTNLYRKLML